MKTIIHSSNANAKLSFAKTVPGYAALRANKLERRKSPTKSYILVSETSLPGTIELSIELNLSKNVTRQCKIDVIQSLDSVFSENGKCFFQACISARLSS